MIKNRTYADHVIAYALYVKIMDLFVGYDVDIARLALFKCQWSLQGDDDEMEPTDTKDSRPETAPQESSQTI